MSSADPGHPVPSVASVASPATRPASKVLLYCGGSSWDAPHGTDHHLATQLATHLPVVYLDPPESVVGQVRARRRPCLRAGLEQAAPNLWRLRPRSLPGVTRPLLRDLAAARSRAAVRRLVREHGLEVVAQVVASLDDLFVPDVAATRVLHGTDDFVAGAHLMGLSRRWLVAREPEQLAAATHVLAVSEVLAERWHRFGHHVELLPNGCDAAAFADVPSRLPDPEVDIASPRAVVVGQLSERLDLDLLASVAASGAPLLLVGPALSDDVADRLALLARRRNVQWVGRVPFDALPGMLASAVVGLTPYVDDDFNRASFPLKTLEYLAAGLAVVSTDLPAARALASPDVALAARTEDFVEAVHRALRAGPDAAAVRRRQTLAAGHSWSVRAATLLGWVGIDDPVGVPGD